MSNETTKSIIWSKDRAYCYDGEGNNAIQEIQKMLPAPSDS